MGSFNGTADLLGLTVEDVSTLNITSALSEVLEVAYDLSFRQGQSICTTGIADGYLEFVNVTVHFTNDDSSQLSDEFILGIYHTDSLECMQFGPGLETCANQVSWPPHFQSSANGLYNALLDVQSYGFTFNEGMEYTICVGNADRLSENPMAYSKFVGTTEFFGFTSERLNVVQVTSGVGMSPLTTTFDVRAKQAQSLCTSEFAMGSLEYVNVSVSFTNGDNTYLSDELIVALYHLESGECVHFGPGLENCENVQPWPEHFQNSSDGLYTALLDVQSFGFSFHEGMEYKICIGNGDRISDDTTAYSEFVGDVELFGFTKEVESTVEITSEVGEVPLTATYDVRARQAQSLCVSEFAMGSLEFVNVTVDFTNGDTTNLSDEFIVALYHLETGECVQFGPGLETCENVQPWPEHFQSPDNGLYTALLDVQSFGFSFHEGMEYSVCIGNGDRISDDTTAYSEFVGDVEFFGFTKEVESTVEITSEVGEVPLTATYDVRARQAQSLCVSEFAMGSLEFVNVTVDFTNGDTTNLSDEFIVALYHLETGECVHFGPGLENCENVEPWPEHFQNSTNGLYTALLDVQSFGFSFHEGMEYTICIGNGDRISDDTTAYSEFVGDVEFFGFTKEVESTVEITSEVGEVPLKATYDVRARQAQSLCVSEFAMGSLEFVNVTVDFTNGDTTNLSDEFIVALYHLETGECVHFGPGLENCDNVQPWPEHFQSPDNGLYTALLDVQSFGFSFHEGMEYSVCIGNGDRISDDTTAYSEFVGDVEFFGFTKEVESTVEITSEVGEVPLKATYDVRARQAQSLCVSEFAMGSLEFVNVTVDFTNGDTTNLSDEFIVALYHLETGECVHFGPGLENCENVEPWPEHFQNSTNGLYTALLDVQSFGFSFHEGMEYTICIGNGDGISDDTTAYSEFVGDVEFFGFTKEVESTVEITSEVGEVPLKATYDVRARQAQSLCVSEFAMGDLLYVNATVDFTNGDTTNLSDEFIVALYHLETGECIQFGPGLETCENVQPWPEHFQSPDNGLYTALLDVQSFGFSFHEGMEYSVCIGNGDRISDDTTAYSEFVGDVEFFGFTKEVESTVEITSEVGEVPLKATYDVRARQAQSLCVSEFAMGSLEFVNVTVDFTNGDTTNLSDEFIVALYHLETGECVQFGPGLETCTYLQAWPEHFQSPNDGVYTALLDVQSVGFSFNEGMEYTVCIGNGDRITDDVSAYSEFVGNVDFFGFTKEIESTVEVTSEVGEVPMMTTFDVRVRQAQSLCTSVFAMGDLQFVNVTVDFTNGDSTYLSDEFIVAFYHLFSGDCVQFGPGLETCTNLQPWPEHFQNASDGTYRALLDVQSFNFNFNEGMEYKVCIGNGDRLTDDVNAYSEFVGEVGFYGYTKEVESTVAVSSEINEEFSLDFDLRLRQEQHLCTSDYAWGNLTSVSISLVYTNGDMSMLSSEFLLVLYDVEAESCIQFGPGVEVCETHVPWPSSFNAIANGYYSGVVDVSAFNFKEGDASRLYKVCFGNAELVSGDPQAYSNYQGDVSFIGMESRTEFAPTMAPTHAVDSSSDGLSDTDIILISSLAPVGVVLIASVLALMWWKNVCGIRERDEMKEELFGREDKKTGGSIDVHQV